MGAYHNALREEGTRSDLLAALEAAWAENSVLEHRVRMLQEAIDAALKVKFDGSCCGCTGDAGFDEVQSILGDALAKVTQP